MTGSLYPHFLNLRIKVNLGHWLPVKIGGFNFIIDNNQTFEVSDELVSTSSPVANSRPPWKYWFLKEI